MYRQIYQKIYRLPLLGLLREIKLRVWLFEEVYIDCPKQEQITHNIKRFRRYWLERFESGEVFIADEYEDLHQLHLPAVHRRKLKRNDRVALAPKSSLRLMTVAQLMSKARWPEHLSSDRPHSLIASTFYDETTSGHLDWKNIRDPEVLVGIDMSQPKSLILRDVAALIDELQSSKPTMLQRKTAWRISKLRLLKARRVFEVVDQLILAKLKDDDISYAALLKTVWADKPELVVCEDFYDTFRKTHLPFVKLLFSAEGYARVKALYLHEAESRKKNVETFIPKKS